MQRAELDTLAPQLAPLLKQNPMKIGSAILTSMLSTQYTWTYLIPLASIFFSTPLLCKARYKPPLPSIDRRYQNKLTIYYPLSIAFKATTLIKNLILDRY